MNGAVITARNEAETIGALVQALRKMGLAVCVVNDGSTDDTEMSAKIAGAHVIRHDEGKGIGRSLKEACLYSLEQGWDYTFQIDAGGSHNPLDCQYAFTGDVMIGSRFLYHSVYDGRKWRGMLSRLTAWACNFATHQEHSDWTSGYRVFSKTALFVLANCQYLTNMHTWQIEVLHEADRKGLQVGEFPIHYKAGDSSIKLSVIDDLIKVYLWILNT